MDTPISMEACVLTARLLEGWRTAFPPVADELGRAGTSVVGDGDRRGDGAIVLWPCVPRVVAEARPEMADRLRGYLADRPTDHRLTIDEVVAAGLAGAAPTRQRDRFYALDPATFRAPPTPEGLTVAVLGEQHRGAVEVFLAACPEDDREEGDVGIDPPHELAVGVLDGARVLAVASVYAWRGFGDVGVLTHPDARRRGAGRLAVAGLCERLLDASRAVVYRHDEANLGSRGIARSLGFVHIGDIESDWPEE
jgi:hypothetical protein